MDDTIRPWMREQYIAYERKREHPPQRIYLSQEGFQAFGDTLLVMERHGAARQESDGALLFKASRVYADESLSGLTALRMEP